MERIKDRKTKQRLSSIVVALATVLASAGVASCTQSETEPGSDRPTPIVVNASVEATAQTKAPVTGTAFPVNTSNVFRLTAYASASATPPASWASVYFSNIQVNNSASGILTPAPVQYYPANGDRLYFYAFAPQPTSLTTGSSATPPMASYTLTGQEDIMAAQNITGIAKAPTGVQLQPTLNFSHKLMQVRFKIVKDPTFEAGKKVTEVLVKNVRNSVTLNTITGSLTFTSAANSTFSLPLTAGTNDEIVASPGTPMDNCLMLEPATTVVLKVTADGVVYDNISVTLTGTNIGQAGNSHLITLTFKRNGITPAATITAWADTGSGSANVGAP